MAKQWNTVDISDGDIDRLVSIPMMVVKYAEFALLVLRVSLLLQIKNTLHLAANMAAAEQEDLRPFHICATLAANGRLVPDLVNDGANELYESWNVDRSRRDIPDELPRCRPLQSPGV